MSDATILRRLIKWDHQSRAVKLIAKVIRTKFSTASHHGRGGRVSGVTASRSAMISGRGNGMTSADTIEPINYSAKGRVDENVDGIVDVLGDQSQLAAAPC